LGKIPRIPEERQKRKNNIRSPKKEKVPFPLFSKGGISVFYFPVTFQ